MVKTMIISNSKYPGITYDMDTGEFYRINLSGWHSIKEGKWGKIDDKGYVQARTNRKTVRLHRLAFEFMGVEITKGKEIDHINGKRSDNRFCNLRLVSTRENAQNRKQHRSGKLIGAIFHKPSKKYISRIVINGKRKKLGEFATKIEAHTAYMNYLDDHNIKYLKNIDNRQ